MQNQGIVPPAAADKSSEKKAPKSVPAVVSRKKRRVVRRVKDSYSCYIYKVLKQVHPNTGISRQAMCVMNNFINDMFERIAVESGKLTKQNKRNTMTAREVQTAVKIVISGELGEQALFEGLRAFQVYIESI